MRDLGTLESSRPQSPLSDESIPQLFIDVHLDDKSIHRLTIYEGDDPKKLALDF